MSSSKGWIRATQFMVACVGVLMIQSASAETAYPLVCQGAMNPEINGATGFNWSMAAASPTPPGPRECAWLDRPPRGSELIPGPKPVVGEPQLEQYPIMLHRILRLRSSFGTRRG